jgi:hypothetical protein
MFLDWKFEWILLNTVRCRQLLTLKRKKELGDLYSKLRACIYKCISMFYMMNSSFKGWHMVVTLVWWDKNFDSCSNFTTKISWVTIIVSPVSPKFKMLQEGLTSMQNKGRTYNLRSRSILYVRQRVGLLSSLKRVLYLPSNDLCKDSLGALQEMVKARIPTITKQTLRYVCLKNLKHVMHEAILYNLWNNMYRI